MFYVVTLTHEILLHPEHFGADLQVLPTLCQTAQALLPIFVFATLGRVAVRLAVGGERGVQGRALNVLVLLCPGPNVLRSRPLEFGFLVRKVNLSASALLRRAKCLSAKLPILFVGDDVW
eukprot:m.101609 g.101609  ORF g.101609 m.101609 type:complete len:120 (-) comp12514_c0_seq1:2528-2887(-)